MEIFMKLTYQNRLIPFKSYNLHNYILKPHIHNQIEIIYVLSGKTIVTLEETPYALKKGNLMLIFPFQLHGIKSFPDCDLLIQIFEPAYASEYIPYIGNYIPENPILHHIEADCLDAIMKADNYYKNNKSMRIIKAYVSLYMSFIYEHMKMKNVKFLDYHNTLGEILIYIDSHYKNDINLSIVAEHLHITKSYISKLFVSKLHSSFTDYVNYLRIEYAIKLIKNSDLSISNIAYECGFLSERTFFRVFKKLNGMTPLQFKRTISSE